MWQPLEQFLKRIRQFHLIPRFMYMGSETSANGSTIHLYKDKFTRSYINIDEVGNHWTYTPNGYKNQKLTIEAIKNYIKDWRC